MSRSWQIYLLGWGALMVALTFGAVSGDSGWPVFHFIYLDPQKFVIAAAIAWSVYSLPWLLYITLGRRKSIAKENQER